ncbi:MULTISPECIES: hypothetical protein [unclassified Bradyrhizobium]|uniref:hypothetical protein n=1 Tax=unclassified Bradyrhizobium TaxID=2631580 RepID=UPI00102EC64E|nr:MULTISPECIES: hypothetical protein [unclassified Bradyrhizobium]MDI4235112.1 hypothetical protein [Bradyrhizobium sp. Arg237L]TAI66381.1 hypothetical protein CWO89_08510 [Bradyrhizobium sp. Leo170]
MNIRLVFGALIVGVVAAIAAPPSPSVAQSTDQGAAAPKSAAPNTNMNPHKHRYWRHRGGRHPHFGSRRVRTDAPAGRPSAN